MVPQPVDRLAQGGRCARTDGRTRAAAGRQRHVNTNVVGIGGRVFAVVEAGSFPVELSRSLEEQRYNPFDGTLAGSYTGHPHHDPLTGETHAIAYDGRIWDSVRHVVLSPTGRVVRDVPVAVEHGPCIHDCAITARFAIVLDLPVTFSFKALLAGYRFPFRWNPAMGLGWASFRGRVGEPTSCGAKSSPASCSTWPTPTTTPTGG